jgi:hypothetical protein
VQFRARCQPVGQVIAIMAPAGEIDDAAAHAGGLQVSSESERRRPALPGRNRTRSRRAGR